VLEARSNTRDLRDHAYAVFERLVAREWWLRVAEGNEAKLIYPHDDPDAVRVQINDVATTAPWDVQLNQPRHRVVAGERMQLSFRARADSPRAIAASFAQAHPPWSNLGLYAHFDLTPDWGTFEVSFEATGNDENARVAFDVGQSATSFDVKSVRLRRLTPSAVATSGALTG
jgi:hypothetical protein